MKNSKATILNPQAPFHELHDQAAAAVKKYLANANQSCRTGSNLPDIIYGLLNEGGIDEIPSYVDALTSALQAMSTDNVLQPLKGKLGEYNFDIFVNMIGLLIKAMCKIQGEDANIAEIIAYDLELGYKSDPDITTRTYLNEVIRKYTAMTENVTQYNADWKEWDKRFE